MCYFSRWKHIAHYKAKNQTTVKTNFRARTHACLHGDLPNTLPDWRPAQHCLTGDLHNTFPEQRLFQHITCLAT